jgi:hypothetical protein
MAAANLAIDAGVLSEWQRMLSVAAGGIEVLSLQLAGEKITLAGAFQAASAAELWSTLAAQGSAALALAPAPLAPGAKPSLLPPRPECRLWLARLEAGGCVFVSFVPEGVHPKSKMLYASARDDLRRNLPGASECLGADYHASEVSELSAAAFAVWAKRDATEAMSSRELQAADIKKTINAERAAMPVRAVGSMQKVPFVLGDSLKQALGGFKGMPSGAPALRWLEVRVGSAAASGSSGGGGGGGGIAEVLELASSGAEGEVKALTAVVWQPAAAEPRFFITMPMCSSSSSSSGSGSGSGAAASSPEPTAASEGAEGGSGSAAEASAPAHPVLLIYHCPEGSKPKARMQYSTAKTALQDSLASEGVVIAKTVSLARPAPNFPNSSPFSLSLSPSYMLFSHAYTICPPVRLLVGKQNLAPPTHCSPSHTTTTTTTTQAETRDEDDIATAFTEFALNPLAKKVSGMAIAEASAGSAKEAAQAAIAASPSSAASRFGGRALPGMPGMMSPAGFKLPGLGEKK